MANSATTLASNPTLKDTLRDKIKDLLQNAPAYLKDKAIQHLKELPKSEAKEQAAELIVSALGKTVGGPFAANSPDRPLAKAIIVDILERNTAGAVWDILLNPEFESHAGDPTKDSPGNQPQGKAGASAVPVQVPTKSASPASSSAPTNEPAKTTTVLPATTVIMPGRISSGASTVEGKSDTNNADQPGSASSDDGLPKTDKSELNDKPQGQTFQVVLPEPVVQVPTEPVAVRNSDGVENDNTNSNGDHEGGFFGNGILGSGRTGTTSPQPVSQPAPRPAPARSGPQGNPMSGAQKLGDFVGEGRDSSNIG